jgi:Cdc6-like AAA superfamily ATPase
MTKRRSNRKFGCLLDVINTQGGNKLVFHRYRRDELVRITESKIGFSVVDQKALEFVAAKVAASSGDARQFLELVSLAIQRRLDTLSNDKLDEELTKPAVGIRDAMMAIRETNVKYKDVIESLTTCEKVTLCAGVHLSRKLEGKAVRLETVKNFTMEAFGFDNDLSLEDFKGVVERLQDNGLLKMAEKEKRSISAAPISTLLRYEVCFDLQLEDVESALEETLMKEDFYQRLVERVKKIQFTVND